MSLNRKSLTWTEIDLDALRQNLAAVRRCLRNPKIGVLAIVKADAYGHGMKAVAAGLWKHGVRFFGVANIEEAMELRHLLPQADILVLGSFHEDQVRLYVEHRVIPTVSGMEDLKTLARMLRRNDRFPIHVKVDTGMGRLGVWHEETSAFFEALAKQKNIVVDGVYTHFSFVDHENGDSTENQI